MPETTPIIEERSVQSQVRRRMAWPAGVVAVAAGSAIGSGIGLYEAISSSGDRNEVTAALGVATLGFAAYALNVARKIPGFAEDYKNSIQNTENTLD